MIFFIVLEVFSLNKVNWLPQYYSQYSPRTISPSVCVVLYYVKSVFL